MYVAQFFFAKIFWKRTSTVLYVFILQKNLNEQDLPPKYFWTNFNQTGKCETNPTSPNTVHGSLFSSHPIHSEQISRVVPRHFDIETCTFLEGTVLWWFSIPFLYGQTTLVLERKKNLHVAWCAKLLRDPKSKTSLWNVAYLIFARPQKILTVTLKWANNFFL